MHGGQNVQMFCFASGLATLRKISSANVTIAIITMLALRDEALLKGTSASRSNPVTDRLR